MILRSIWTVFKDANLHTKKVSGISPATKHLFCSDFLLDFIETYDNFITKVEFLNSKSTIDREKLEILVNTKY